VLPKERRGRSPECISGGILRFCTPAKAGAQERASAAAQRPGHRLSPV